MAAGQQYNKSLNLDVAGVKTPAIYDPNLNEWLMLAGNCVMTAGGVWIFQRGTNDGAANVAVAAGTNIIGKTVPVDADGDEKFTDANPASMKLTGRLTAITHSVLTVTTTSQQVLAANPDRKYAMLINDSDTVIYIKIGAPAVVGEGIRLNPNGGSYEMSSAIGNLHTGAINAIHGGTGTKNLLIAEGV